MASIGSSLSFGSATQIKVTNLPVPTPNVEVPLVLQDGCRFIEISPRNNRTVTKLAFVSGNSGTIYKTIPRANAWCLSGMTFNGVTLYVQCDQADTLEIVELY